MAETTGATRTPTGTRMRAALPGAIIAATAGGVFLSVSGYFSLLLVRELSSWADPGQTPPPIPGLAGCLVGVALILLGLALIVPWTRGSDATIGMPSRFRAAAIGLLAVFGCAPIAAGVGILAPPLFAAPQLLAAPSEVPAVPAFVCVAVGVVCIAVGVIAGTVVKRRARPGTRPHRVDARSAMLISLVVVGVSVATLGVCYVRLLFRMGGWLSRLLEFTPLFPGVLAFGFGMATILVAIVHFQLRARSATPTSGIALLAVWLAPIAMFASTLIDDFTDDAVWDYFPESLGAILMLIQGVGALALGIGTLSGTALLLRLHDAGHASRRRFWAAVSLPLLVLGVVLTASGAASAGFAALIDPDLLAPMPPMPVVPYLVCALLGVGCIVWAGLLARRGRRPAK